MKLFQKYQQIVTHTNEIHTEIYSNRHLTTLCGGNNPKYEFPSQRWNDSPSEAKCLMWEWQQHYKILFSTSHKRVFLAETIPTSSKGLLEQHTIMKTNSSILSAFVRILSRCIEMKLILLLERFRMAYTHQQAQMRMKKFVYIETARHLTLVYVFTSFERLCTFWSIVDTANTTKQNKYTFCSCWFLKSTRCSGHT